MANGDKKFSTRLKEEKKIPKKVEKGFSASENPRAGSNSSKINLTNSSAGTVGNVAIAKTSNLNNIVAFTGMSNGAADQFSNVSREIQKLGLNKSLPVTIVGDK